MTKHDCNKKIKGIISETVSHIIDNKKGGNELSPKKSAVGSVSITKGQVTRNNLLRKGSISTINMRRILYHMRHRDDEDNSNSTKKYLSISCGSMNDNTYAPSCTCIGGSSRNERAMEMAEEMIHSHRYTHMLGEHMDDSISPSVPFLEISSLNTYDDVVRTDLDSHANMVLLGQNCRLEDPKEPSPGKPGSRYAIVSAFSPDHKPMRVQVVDASIAYWCPINETT